MIPVHHLFTTLGSWTLVHVGPEEGRVVQVYLQALMLFYVYINIHVGLE